MAELTVTTFFSTHEDPTERCDHIRGFRSSAAECGAESPCGKIPFPKWSKIEGRRLHGELGRQQVAAHRGPSVHDGAARQPRGARHGRQTTPSGGARLARRKQPTTAFVPFRTVRFPTLPNRLPIDHANASCARRRAEESPTTESKGRTAIHGQARFTYRCGCPNGRRLSKLQRWARFPARPEVIWRMSVELYQCGRRPLAFGA